MTFLLVADHGPFDDATLPILASGCTSCQEVESTKCTTKLTDASWTMIHGVIAVMVLALERLYKMPTYF